MAYMHQIRFRLGLLSSKSVSQKVTNFFTKKILKEQNAESTYSF